MKRRHFMVASAAATLPCLAAAKGSPGVLGIATASYRKRWRGNYSNLRFPPFRTVLDLLDHVRGLGVTAVQVGVQDWTADLTARIRTTCESYGLRLEGSIDLPKASGDVARFERELRMAKEAGATIFRSALGGRRYELFSSHEEFLQWRRQAAASMALAEPLARRMAVRIGVENHKDFECEDLVSALRQISSPHLGACIDLGNSLALLEDPQEVVAALAPFAVTVHLKDLAVREVDDGFQMAEVALGKGFLPLPAMVEAIRAANPGIAFHLEMITRDPLEIPCITPRYWSTFPNKPGAHLARTLATVRAFRGEIAQPISHHGVEDLLKMEERNITNSLAYAVEHLHLGEPSAPKERAKSDRGH